MITVGTLFDGYLNINILLIVATLIWAGVRLVMRLLSHSENYALKLRLFKALILTCFALPIMVELFDRLVRQGGRDAAYSLSLSDLVVTQYLHGSLDVKAAELDQILGLRGRFTEEFLALNSQFAFIVAGLLLLGLLIGLARLLVSLYRLHTILDNCFTWRRFGNVHLLLSERVTTPFSTRGLFNRYIVIPVAMLEHGKDLHIALSHEFQHLRQRDTEWEVGLEFLHPLFFWNPAFYVVKRNIERLRELGCDQLVVARKAISVQDYCACLLRTCESGLKRREHMLRARPSVAFVQVDGSGAGVGSMPFLKLRMLSLIRGRKTGNHGLIFVAFVVPTVALVCLAGVMMQKPNDWSHDRIMFSTIINLDRLAARNHQ
ncbi:M56 family metallopeptidase [uncultured Cohaesibacter sp.]|uniref:M56 family metallopeptidase n=1 Tax=uncultured Cohaesibacter sp. TaxID=1002546 RepID=UPI0029C79955|nr:M56 family metallopeptidase [uncultured Cohaesibacter sp.]